MRSRWNSLKAMGWVPGGLYYLSRALALASRGRIRLIVYYIVAQPVRRMASVPTNRGQAIEVREIAVEEALALPVDRPGHVISSRFRQGARCLMASAKGRFLGFLWFLAGPYEEDEVRCRFVPLPREIVAWDFDVFVEPSARLGFTFARLWDEANNLLSSQGIEWSLSRISAFNANSLASHQRLGIKRVAVVAFLCAGPVQFMLSTSRPYIHMALNRGSRPILNVSPS